MSIAYSGYSDAWRWTMYLVTGSNPTVITHGSGTSVTLTPPAETGINVSWLNLDDHSGSILCEATTFTS